MPIVKFDIISASGNKIDTVSLDLPPGCTTNISLVLSPDNINEQTDPDFHY